MTFSKMFCDGSHWDPSQNFLDISSPKKSVDIRRYCVNRNVIEFRV